MRLSRFLYLCIFIILLPSNVSAGHDKKKVVMIVMAGDSLITARAFREIKKLPNISKQYSFQFYTDREIRSNRVKGNEINGSDIILADFMNRNVDVFLAANLKDKKTKVYSLRCAYLADKLKKEGFYPDLQSEQYYSPATVENIKNLIFLVLSNEGEKLSYEKPFSLPKSGIFHPDAPKIFSGFDEYLEWYREKGEYNQDGFWVGIHTFATSVSRVPWTVTVFWPFTR